MAPSTPNRPATAPHGQQPPQATPPDTYPTLEEELNLPMDTEDEEEEEIAPAHPSSHEDEVTKLKRKIRELKKQHNELLNAARYNSEVAKTKIEDLEGRVTNIAGIAENLGKEAEKSQRLYKEHIEHTAALALTGKDPGEILRPRQPDPYGGEPEKLQGFLTSLRSYQMYYPIQFSTDELRVRHAMSFLKDKAQRLMEPIVRDFVNNPPYARKEMTTYVYEKYEYFEKELTYAFGIADEKREAEMKIRQLTQKGSAAAYLAEYRFQAAKLDWNEAAHMAQVYLGLKSEVKDAMVYIRDKPKNLNDLAAVAVEIDNQQFERRKEKQASKQGGSYNPSWNKNNSNGNRNHANQGKSRQPDTSYGTHAGPMNVNAMRTGRPAPTCWNCGKKGHREPECRNPVKTNQKYKPVLE
ncbi:gag polyprotein, partial [Fusarium flagelliforme]